MIVLFRRKRLWLTALLLVLLFLGLLAGNSNLYPVHSDDLKYRVFVAGIGTVEGKWCGTTGIAVIGLETRPAPKKDQELKIIDLLIVNNSSAPLRFNSDVALINTGGKRYGLNAQGQPEVVIGPGAMSQGTVIINVPGHIPDSDWMVEVRGGSLQQAMMLPLKVVKVVNSHPNLNRPTDERQ